MRGGRRPGGGRPKGSPNKRTLEVQERLAELGCDPIEGMARIAMNMDNSEELRGRMFAELAQYVAPKRKAIEASIAGTLGYVPIPTAERDPVDAPAGSAGRGDPTPHR